MVGGLGVWQTPKRSEYMKPRARVILTWTRAARLARANREIKFNVANSPRTYAYFLPDALPPP
jgi:hypothetical protein